MSQYSKTKVNKIINDCELFFPENDVNIDVGNKQVMPLLTVNSISNIASEVFKSDDEQSFENIFCATKLKRQIIEVGNTINIVNSNIFKYIRPFLAS